MGPSKPSRLLQPEVEQILILPTFIFDTDGEYSARVLAADVGGNTVSFPTPLVSFTVTDADYGPTTLVEIQATMTLLIRKEFDENRRIAATFVRLGCQEDAEVV